MSVVEAIPGSESKSTKPKFIVLCGPTGVGKSRIPKQIFNLEPKDFTKIEIDSLVVENKLYRTTVYTINKLDPNLIPTTINDKDAEKREFLTNLFNILYSSVKSNVIPCLENDAKEKQFTEKISCEQLHDKLLGEAIIDRKTIVLEINGDKSFKWLFDYTGKSEDFFTDAHREIIREEYETTIFYLSYNYRQLLDSNKDRFIANITDCHPKSCIARLGNFFITYQVS
jgi:ATP-dependent protease HslVU (ClpYQ) ATPase subunit